MAELADIAKLVMLCLISAIVVMSTMFIIAQTKKRYDYIDSGWGLSFIAIAWTSFLLRTSDASSQFNPRLLVTLLVTLWGIRLSYHILKRTLSSKTQDRRYTELIAKWPDKSPIKIYVKLFLAQAGLSLLVSSGVIHINLSGDVPWSIWTSIGLLIWTAGFIFESIADYQLKQFIGSAENKGKLMTSGLWKYSRHPNYFGEITMWWGISAVSLGTKYGWIGLGGAAFITFLIVYVSGLPLSETNSASRPGWKEYKARTAVLIPFFNR